MTNHRYRRHAPGHQQFSQRVFGHEQRWLSYPGLVQFAGCSFGRPLRRIDDLTQVEAEMRLKDLAAAVYFLSKRRLFKIEPGPSIDVLCALSRKHKEDGAVIRLMQAREHPLRGAPFQRPHRLL